MKCVLRKIVQSWLKTLFSQLLLAMNLGNKEIVNRQKENVDSEKIGKVFLLSIIGQSFYIKSMLACSASALAISLLTLLFSVHAVTITILSTITCRASTITSKDRAKEKTRKNAKKFHNIFSIFTDNIC